MKVVVTNDDGIGCPGLRVLYEAVAPLGEAIIIAPVEARSARGGVLTLEEPIRVYEMKTHGVVAYGITGSPRDVVHVAREVLGGVDILVAGVNVGENTSIQNILVSGTVGAAAEAALFSIPAAAFSADVDNPLAFLDERYTDFVTKVIRAVVTYMASRKLPAGIDLINVNIPRVFKGLVKVAPPARLRYIERLERRVDPRGRPYFWLYGEAAVPEQGTDSYVLFVEKGVSLTPLSLNLGINTTYLLQDLAVEVEKVIRNAKI
ncbi:MAG: 5'/3'-nucleotidase SurE [Thermofilaceae archaeon]